MELPKIKKSEHGMLEGIKSKLGFADANPHYDASDPDDARRTAAAHHALDDAALEFGGSLSGEHGGGCLKDVGKQLGADELEAMRAVRRLFDPQGILNPGKGY